MYKSISLNDQNFDQKLINGFMEDGVIVVNDVFNDDECRWCMNNILSHFMKLNTGVDYQNIVNTWTPDRLPPFAMTGIPNALCSNIQAVWNIRAHPNVFKLFKILYSHIRGKQIDDFICSSDRINIIPNGKEIVDDTFRDWPHCDQTVDGIFKSIQGQAVLTNTTATFMASPKSCHVYDKIRSYYGVAEDDKTNWVKFSRASHNKLKKIIEDAGGQWQIPIWAKKGSFILWTSTTVHSARPPLQMEKFNPADYYYGWRGVVYVCYRPKEEMTNDEITLRRRALLENLSTNHLSDTILGEYKPGTFFTNDIHPNIKPLLLNPKLVYNLRDPLQLNDMMKKLAGF